MAKTKMNRKRIILMAVIVAVAGLGVWYATRAKSSPAKTASTASTETKTDVNTDEANKNDPTLGGKANTSSDTTTASNSKNLAIVISRPVNNDTVPLAEGIEVRSVISGTTSGNCTLTATGPNGKTVTKTAKIVAQTSYGSCSIDVTSSEVVAGEWQIALTATSDDSTAKANFTVKVQ